MAIGKTEVSPPVSLVLTLSDSKGVLGSATGTVGAGASATTQVTLTAAGYARVQSGGGLLGLAATLKVVATDNVGNPTTVNTAIRVHS